MGKYSVIESRHLDRTCALPAELATHANHHTARLFSNCCCCQFLFFPSGIQQLRRILCSLFRQQAAVLQVLIAGAVIAGGFILYNIIQNDPEAKKALGDAKGTTFLAMVTRLTDLSSADYFCYIAGQAKGAWSEAKGQTKEAYHNAKGQAKEATS